MIRLHDVLEGTGGNLHGAAGPDLLFNRVIHDSRLVEPGDLFVALHGEQQDGHAFIPAALTAGAAGVLVDEGWLQAHQGEAFDYAVIVVPDTLEALQRLAAFWRNLYDIRLVGITGSIGKSSTKEVVAAVAAARFNVLKSVGSYNNEVGLPISVLELTPDTEVAVLEMGGAYRFGEITELAEIARPDIGVVTNVTHSHLSRMGSLEAIARTKVELVRALPEDGLAILNADDERVRAMAAEARCRVLTYGLTETSDLRAADVVGLGSEGIQFTLIRDGERDRVTVPLLGRHSVHMTLVGFAVGFELGMELPDVLHGFESPDVQLRLILTPAHNGATILDDHYNANPESSNAALTLLEDLDARRRLAVFGDMLEMGDFEEEAHRIVGRRAAEVADGLLTVGDRAQYIHDEFRQIRPERLAMHFDTKEDLTEGLRDVMREGDLILVKGSRGVQMETVIEALRLPDPDEVA
ncbi:UDP-N-acetylmuramoyl-tripeptide--D-alanyl-D-alanine ligase [soil metagenome]